jgi:hypothetical protein
MPLHSEAGFVHEAMVGRAEQQKVVERGFTTLGPMVDVVGIEIAFVVTTGERAGAVAGEERAFERRWNGSLFAPHVECLAVSVIDDRDDGAIAAEPTHRR